MWNEEYFYKIIIFTGHAGLTFDEIVGQCFLFFNAGFQTTSATLTFAIYELTQRLDLQDKIRDEIHRVLAKHENKITYDSLNEMHYMEQVIKGTYFFSTLW